VPEGLFVVCVIRHQMNPRDAVAAATATAVVFVFLLLAASSVGHAAAQDDAPPEPEIDTSVEFEDEVRAGEETTVAPVAVVDETPVSATVTIDLTMYVDGEAVETQSFEETVSNDTVVRRVYTHTFEEPGVKDVEFTGTVSALDREVTGSISEEVTVLPVDENDADDGEGNEGDGNGGSYTDDPYKEDADDGEDEEEVTEEEDEIGEKAEGEEDEESETEDGEDAEDSEDAEDTEDAGDSGDSETENVEDSEVSEENEDTRDSEDAEATEGATDYSDDAGTGDGSGDGEEAANGGEPQTEDETTGFPVPMEGFTAGVFVVAFVLTAVVFRVSASARAER